MARGVSWLVRTAVAIGTGLSAFAVLGSSAMADPNRVVLRAIACTLIGAILLLASAVPIYFFAYPELRALLVFEPTVGTVTRGEVASGPGRGRTDNPDIRFTYRVNGVEYNTGRYRIVDAGADSKTTATRRSLSLSARQSIGCWPYSRALPSKAASRRHQMPATSSFQLTGAQPAFPPVTGWRTQTLGGSQEKRRSSLPVISTFVGIVIRMFYREHGVPHFHAEYQGQRAIFTFDGQLLAGDLHSRTALRLIREWSLAHRPELDAN